MLIGVHMAKTAPEGLEMRTPLGIKIEIILIGWQRDFCMFLS